MYVGLSSIHDPVLLALRLQCAGGCGYGSDRHRQAFCRLLLGVAAASGMTYFLRPGKIRDQLIEVPFTFAPHPAHPSPAATTEALSE